MKDLTRNETTVADGILQEVSKRYTWEIRDLVLITRLPNHLKNDPKLETYTTWLRFKAG